MKVCVIGLGYIGLPTAVMLANSECDVIGFDASEEIVNAVNQGVLQFEEEELEEQLKECVKNKQLYATIYPERADAFIICTPAPNSCEYPYGCEVSGIKRVCKMLLPYLVKSNTVVVETIIAPRTLEDEIKPIFEEYGFTIGKDLYLAYSPNDSQEGKALSEIKNNNRIVGGVTKTCAEHAAKIYRRITTGKVVKTAAATAEMSRCVEDTYRDVNIALSNEIAKVCNELKINCFDVVRIANEHPSVEILKPGPGAGGPRLSSTPNYISEKAPETSRLIRTGRKINSTMPYYVVQSVIQLLKGIQKPRITIFGVSYKGNTEDMTESPAVTVLNMLRAEGFITTVYDPHVSKYKSEPAEELVREQDMILILTDHKEFVKLPYDEYVKTMRHPIIFDTRNILGHKRYKLARVINYGNLYESSNSQVKEEVLHE